jgi:hypothetical protein
MNTQSTKPELDERFSLAAQNWLVTTLHEQLRELLSRPGKDVWHGFPLDFYICYDRHKLLIDEVLKSNAQMMMEKWDQALVAAQKLLLLQESQASPDWSVKTKVHVRLRVSQVPPFWCPNMPRSEEVGMFKLVSGTVVRAGKMKLVERQREMKCGKCGHQFVLIATVERDLSFPEVLS